MILQCTQFCEIQEVDSNGILVMNWSILLLTSIRYRIISAKDNSRHLAYERTLYLRTDEFHSWTSCIPTKKYLFCGTPEISSYHRASNRISKYSIVRARTFADENPNRSDLIDVLCTFSSKANFSANFFLTDSAITEQYVVFPCVWIMKPSPPCGRAIIHLMLVYIQLQSN